MNPFTDNWIKTLLSKANDGDIVYLPTLPFSASAALILRLAEQQKRPVLAITDRPQSLDVLARDMSALSATDHDHVFLLPERDLDANPLDNMQGDIIGDRLRFFAHPHSAKPQPIRIASIQGLIQPCRSAVDIDDLSIQLEVNQDFEQDELLKLLEEGNYQFDLEVLAKGQASVRGGLVDCWPPTELWPLRIEFFGDTVDSIRSFDPANQQTRDKLKTVFIVPATDADTPDTSNALEFIPDNALWVWLDEPSILHHGELFRTSVLESGRTCPEVEDIQSRLKREGLAAQMVINDEIQPNTPPHNLQSVDSVPSVHSGDVPIDRIEQARRNLIEHVLEHVQNGWTIHMCFDTPGVMERFEDEYLSGQPAVPNCLLAPLSEGFQNAKKKLAVYSEGDLYGYHRQVRGRYDPLRKRKGPQTVTGSRLTEWSDIQPGDFVVHVEQGIGKYHGIIEIEFDGQRQEVLSIEYAEDTRLYVPVSQSHLLSRYIGSNKSRPRLHTLGGNRWNTEKATARRAAEDLASVLLENQADRDISPGHAFAEDNTWQKEFESTFPFEETIDQAQAIEDVKTDMERSRPMDRLVCGDVGFGKTEVAMRAAFKAVMDGKQVAILVPTTVLAQQHGRSFRERMAAFPVTIEVLSRFKTPAEQRKALEDLADGRIDIMIGTHRLVQPDVRFRDLGLVIIDEEQRFGVKHKEHLKRMKSLVDVMTLSATPIPRTLYMSLTGARDLSTIQTPPRERQPVETVVANRDLDLIRKVILKEVNRGGQVYFLHNRVKTIHAVGKELAEKIPDVSIGIGHGQMGHRELEGTLETFVAGHTDVLLCTTIIESGIDIPNVNTIIIDRADHFGVAELYQLRGRVGRFKRKAYAYLLMPERRGAAFTAKKRVHAIQKFSALGSGFKVAMQDLEIRGAGNILGAQQSGHIAAVGFELYCQFLKRTIARRKGEKPPTLVDVEVKLDFLHLIPSAGDHESTAAIPYDYIEDENHRLHLFRRIAGFMNLDETEALLQEMRDRFGPLPASVKRLVAISRLRILAAERNIISVEVRDKKVILMNHRRQYIKPGAQFPRLKKHKIDDRLTELETWIRELPIHA